MNNKNASSMYPPEVDIAQSEDSPCTFRSARTNKARFVWEITSKCNLDCFYCFRTDPEKMDIPSQDVLRIASQFDQKSTESVILTGGEPFLSKDVHNIITLLTERRVPIKITTNLSFSSNAIKDIAFLDKVGVSTSLDGHNEEVHDAIRGLGSINKIRKNVVFLRSIGNPVSARCVLTCDNAHLVDEIVDFAASIGFKSLTFSRLTQVPDSTALDMTQAKGDKSPSQQQIEDFFTTIRSVRERLPGFPVRTAGFVNASKSCAVAGRTLFYINSLGLMHPCTLYRVPGLAINLRLTDLAEGMRSLASVGRDQGQSTCPALKLAAPGPSG